MQAATISCIAHGVTITMYPKDIAAIVRDADPFNLRSNETTWNKDCWEETLWWDYEIHEKSNSTIMR